VTAVSKRRPSRTDLEALLRETGGNIAKTSCRIGCSRTTLYTWIYQLGLDRLAGIVPRELLLARTAARKSEEAAERKVRVAQGPGLVSVTVRLPGELWRWARIAAIDHDATASAIVTDALELYRAISEGAQAKAEDDQ